MEIPIISHVLFEDAFLAVDRRATSTIGLRRCLDDIMEQYGDDDGIGLAIIQRVAALMRVSHRAPVCRFVRAVGNRHEMPRSFMIAAASSPLLEGGDFDPVAFAEAALLAWPSEGEA